MSQFHTLAASSGYIESLLERFATNRDDLPEDWRAALLLLDAYFPNVVIPAAGRGDDADSLRRFAHLAAHLDPLARTPPARWNRLRSQVAAAIVAIESRPDKNATARLHSYLGHLAVETGHIDDMSRVAWIYAHREQALGNDSEVRKRALQAVVKAEAFERFMAQRFGGKKRFGAEGAESVHALLQRLLDRAAAVGVEEVIVGTMHRGRLGLMTCLFGQPPEELFFRMRGNYPFAEAGRSADVPYHLGLDTKYCAPTGTIRLTLLPNPSHLEAVNAVALGYARQRQDALGSAAKVLPLILHTDASVVAQGVVSEAIQFAEVPGHQVGGVLNVIINNQLGFTTDPEAGRSSRHCTAPWKAIDSLIAHVNGGDVDAVLAAADIAFDYRQAFALDGVIDLVCLRANGHNEVDEPRFTQPQYYELAARTPAISAQYAETLIGDQIILPEFPLERAHDYGATLELAFGASSSVEVRKQSVEPAPAAAPIEQEAQRVESEEHAALEGIAALAARVPEDGQFNKKAVRLITQRGDEWRSAVSWATGEVLAVGAILSMGWGVRFTGQDVDRGAFSQRHLSLVDRSGIRRTVFEAAPSGWGRLEVFDTPLSEYAALSFEYGYSVAAARTLTIWEAQFGDFVNVAQTALDQFISSGAEKWRQSSGLVVLLPHGLEGQGPEHSSGRIERMLQLAAKDNMRIAHPSTPASYFHLLLSQVRDIPRRPLIIFTPKKLLRLKAATSPPTAFESGGFQRLIATAVREGTRIKRVLVCSGKLYYDLLAAAMHGDHDVMLVRLEQLYPFPENELAELLRRAPLCELVWVQEEPANFGAWTWIRSRLEMAMARAGVQTGRLRFLSRPESPSPAGSFHSTHDADQAQLVASALEGA